MKMKITLHGVAYEVDVEVLDEGEGFFSGSSSVPQIPRIIPSVPAPANVTTPVLTSAGKTPVTEASSPSSKKVLSPVGGIIVEVKKRAGESVKRGDEILILEAMKMHTSIAAPVDGKIKVIPVAAGDTVRESQVLIEFE